MDFGFDSDFDIEITDSAFQKSYGLRWKHEYGGTVACRPCESDGIVYFGCDNYYFYALDSETGKEVWKFKSGGCAGNYAPAVVKNMVFFGSYDGFLYAFEKTTGKLLWKFRTGERVVPGIAEKDGRIVFGSSDGNVYCLDMKGNEIWRFKTGDEIVSTPSIIGEMIYIGSYDCNMYCLSLEGKELWRFRTGGAVGNVAPVNVHGDHVYFGSWDLTFYCVDRHTGKEKWRFKTSQGILSGGLCHDNVVYFGSKEGFHALDMETGEELWSIKFGSEYLPHATNVCEYNGNIYFGGGEDTYERGLIACVDRNGKFIWKFITNGPSWVGPYIKNGMLFASSWNCYFYRLDPETGKEVWKFRTGGNPSKEKVIDHSEVALITIITGEGVTVDGEKPGKYNHIPDIQIIESEYITRSEYSSGEKAYKSESGYR
jgi:outer membrane protein assembly factor BamB